jgi:N-acetylmuramoyl-L-alanine amidase
MGIHKDEGNLQVAMKENAVITLEDDYSTRYMGYDPNSSESFITFSLMQNIYLEQSLRFASFIQNQFRERVGLQDRGVKQAGFLVLWQTTMPSVLVEAGFSSNLDEERFLMSAEGQDFIASAIFRAFRDYKAAIDQKSDFSTVKNIPREISDAYKIDFRVQIATSGSRSDLLSENFKGLKELSEIVSGRYYKYATGHFSSYREAADHRKIVQNSFPDAFVIAVRGDEIVPLQEAIEKLNKD